MSEAEKIKRQNYKKNRNKLILIQLIFILIFSLGMAAAAVEHYQANKAYYIDYSESGNVDYMVHLKPNSSYPDEWLGEDGAYVASLIDAVRADFEYELSMDTAGVEYEYSYEIDAVLKIIDKTLNKALYEQAYPVKESTTLKQNSNSTLKINETVMVDYSYYNNIANSFVDAYGLTNTSASVSVSMRVNVVGTCSEFSENSESDYTVALNIPLSSKTIDIQMSTSVPGSENKILASADALNPVLFKNTAIVLGVIDALLVVALILFIYLTRNDDINYTIKVKRLVSAYRSFIQKINNEFNTDGYQILLVDSFTEMLGIRDTIQSPVLMSENEDKTATRFIIPTNTKILYMYEIKVDDYDKIYGIDNTVQIIDLEPETPEPTVEDTLEDTVLFVPIERAEPAVEKHEPIQEPVCEEPEAKTVIVVTETLPETEIAEEDDDLKIKYSRSFEANLIQSEDEIKGYYSAIKNALLSYKGVKSRFSWRYDSFNIGRQQLVKLKIRGKTLLMYCALNPAEFSESKYFHEVADNKKLADVPMLVKVKSERALKRALELVDALRDKYSLASNAKFTAIDYVTAYPYETTSALVARELIKILNDDGMPIKDDHKRAEAEKNKEQHLPVIEEVIEPLVLNEDEAEVVSEAEKVTGGFKRKSGYSRSFVANLIQTTGEVKKYYSTFKNYILSHRRVKSRISWRFDSFNFGRTQLVKLKIRGKTIYVYLALNPAEFAETRYFQKTAEAKKYADVPMLVKIKSERGLKRAIELVDAVMQKNGIDKNPKAKVVDYEANYPFEKTDALIKKELIKLT